MGLQRERPGQLPLAPLTTSRPHRTRSLTIAIPSRHQEQNDLSFRAGDIVEIVAETNADWWTGKINGRQGLFPSNYVEKLSDNASSYASPPAFSPPPDTRGPPQSSYSPAYPQSSYQQSPPPPSAYQSGPPAQYQQPPPPQAYNPYMGPPMQPQPPQQQQVVQQQEAPQPKPSKFGGLGQTVSAVASSPYARGSDCRRFFSCSSQRRPLAVSVSVQVRVLQFASFFFGIVCGFGRLTALFMDRIGCWQWPHQRDLLEHRHPSLV